MVESEVIDVPVGDDGFEEFDIRTSVLEFGLLMTQKLDAVDDRYPEGWGNDDIEDLFELADARMDRLYLAIENGEPIDVVGGYAVDVANWMMMIADNVGYLNNFHGR